MAARWPGPIVTPSSDDTEIGRAAPRVRTAALYLGRGHALGKVVVTP